MTSLRDQWVGVARESPPYVPLPSSAVGTVTGEGASLAALWAALRIVTGRVGGPWTHELPTADPRLPEWTLTVADDVQSILLRGPACVSVESEATVRGALEALSTASPTARAAAFRVHHGMPCGGAGT